jgi:hypothetical protein
MKTVGIVCAVAAYLLLREFGSWVEDVTACFKNPVEEEETNED